MVCPLRKVPALLAVVLLSIAFVATACRDIDQLPPLPVFDPNAPPLDGGGPDVAEDGDIT